MYTEDIRLTMHGLYRILTQRDFPVPTYRVFPENVLQGETLLRFWYGFCREALPEDLDLSFLDPEQMKRNRSASRWLNASGSSRLMEDWFQSLSGRLDPALLIRMTQVWMKHLEDGHYNPEALALRLDFLLKECPEGGPFSDGETTRFLGQLREELREAEAASDWAPVPALLLHGAVLSWLTLLAMYASRPQDPALNRLRIQCGTSCTDLYRLFRSPAEETGTQVLSLRQCVLCAPALPDADWFGREKELDRAMKQLKSCGKLAVTGIGGIGKTEFVRQLLFRLLRRQVYRRIAFIQYEGSMAGKSYKVTAVAAKALYKDTTVTSLTIGKNVKTIGKNSFYGCKKLTQVKGAAGITMRGDNAFAGCVKLASLPSLAKLTTIGATAFKGCTALKSVTIGKNVKAIGKNAFYGCKNLKTVTVKTSKLTDSSVKAGAFKGIYKKATFSCPKKHLAAYKKLLLKKGAVKTCVFR